jgi:hypothetical protein
VANAVVGDLLSKMVMHGRREPRLAEALHIQHQRKNIRNEGKVVFLNFHYSWTDYEKMLTGQPKVYLPRVQVGISFLLVKREIHHSKTPVVDKAPSCS